MSLTVYCYFLTILFYTASGANLCLPNDVHALILARGGSKGISNKNLLEINGVSILGRAILTIKKSSLFEYVWVSTDSESISKESYKYGVRVHRRPEIYAQDNTPSIVSVKEFLDNHPTIEKFALFQCTSIFLKEKYIQEAMELFEQKECVFAVRRSHELRWIEFNNTIQAINFDVKSRPRRQEWSGELLETGMFYFSTRQLVEQNLLQNERCGVVIIDEQDSMEIDVYNDVETAKCLCQNEVK